MIVELEGREVGAQTEKHICKEQDNTEIDLEMNKSEVHDHGQNRIGERSIHTRN